MFHNAHKDHKTHRRAHLPLPSVAALSMQHKRVFHNTHKDHKTHRRTYLCPPSRLCLCNTNECFKTQIKISKHIGAPAFSVKDHKTHRRTYLCPPSRRCLCNTNECFTTHIKITKHIGAPTFALCRGVVYATQTSVSQHT